MKDFWRQELEKNKILVFLAPMDWYTDSAYRQVVKKYAPFVYCVSEFFSADWLYHSKFLADSVLPHHITEEPLVIQIFWKDPLMFVEAGKIIQKDKYSITWIDINMWCPAKKVLRSWHWSSLIINTETAFEIVRKINNETKLPISVKTRLSYDGNWNLIEFAKWLEEAGASLLTVHGRTTKEWYTWVARFDDIYELKNHLSIPLVCNWDIKNYEDWVKKLKNLDWFMIGRGSFGNPWCFVWEVHIKDENFLKQTWLKKENFIDWAYHPTLNEILEAMEFHALKLVEVKWEKKWSLEIRKHLVQYLKNFPWVKKYRKELVTTDSFKSTLNIINAMREEFGEVLEKRPSLGEVNNID